jgi:3-hydroxyisobutyrate dehydrogenase-like beta-hydroxyacid dehydrogenase
MSITVGVVGLGAMGSAIAIRLCQAGFDVIGLDLYNHNMSELEDHGGRRADTPRKIAEEAGRRLKDLDITLLDCTVSGSRATCLDGDLATFASGDAKAFERSSSVFQAFANPLHWMGEFGNASRIKYVLNYLVCINNAASAEALSYATKMGLDPQQVYDLVNTSVARSRIWELRAKMMVDGDYTTSRGTYNISRKDAKIIGAIAQEIESPSPVFSSALQMHYAGMAQGYAKMDTASLYEVYKRAAGVKNIVDPD